MYIYSFKYVVVFYIKASIKCSFIPMLLFDFVEFCYKVN